MIDSVIELVSFIAIIVALALSLFYAVKFKIKINSLASTIVQQSVDANYTKSKLAEALLEIESNKLENTEGFIKFISESRDWAFKYIEDVQTTIVAVKTDWDNGNQMEESIEKLFTFLPENNKEK